MVLTLFTKRKLTGGFKCNMHDNRKAYLDDLLGQKHESKEKSQDTSILLSR